MKIELTGRELENCARFGLDPKAVASLARRFSRLGVEAQRLGIEVFGGSGAGSLRPLGAGGAQNTLAELLGHFDGGDGGDEF